MLLAKRVGRPHSQNAHRPIVGNTQVILQRQPGVHHLTGVTITAFAIVSELHRMGGAQDQLNPQQPFKGLQAAADGRLGSVHLPCGGGERSGLYDADIGAHQLNAVYTLLSFHFSFAYTCYV